MSLTVQTDLDIYVHEGKSTEPLPLPPVLYVDMSAPGEGWIATYVVCIHCSRMWIGIVSVINQPACPDVQCPGCKRAAYPRAKWLASCEFVCRCGNRWKQFYLDNANPTQARCVKCHAPTSDLRPWPTRE